VLAEAGLAVQVLDRGQRVGGRIAVDEHAGRPVDIGASYFTVSDARFAEVVRDWESRGLARPWTDTFEVYADGRFGPRSTGPLRWAAGGGLRALVQDLSDSAGLSVERAEVTTVCRDHRGLTVDDRPAAAVVLAMPDPQAGRILHSSLAAVRAGLYAGYEPVLAVSAGWPRRSWPECDGVFVHGDERLSWIADDGRRRGDGAPVLVGHCTPAWAAEHLAQPEAAIERMTQALRTVLGIDTAPSWTRVHRWTYARPAAGRAVSFQLWPSLVGACGDGWSQRPRVEAAFLSGRQLGQALAVRLG
jgi:predicted NAD/FAD-dependent oxidoreductase